MVNPGTFSEGRVDLHSHAEFRLTGLVARTEGVAASAEPEASELKNMEWKELRLGPHQSVTLNWSLSRVSKDQTCSVPSPYIQQYRWVTRSAAHCRGEGGCGSDEYQHEQAFTHPWSISRVAMTGHLEREILLSDSHLLAAEATGASEGARARGRLQPLGRIFDDQVSSENPDSNVQFHACQGVFF